MVFTIGHYQNNTWKKKKYIYIYYIYRDATNYGQSGLILLWLNFTSYSWTIIINSFCNTSMYLYGSANKACSCCCWIRNFNIPQGPAPYPWAFELFKVRLIKFSFSPPKRPSLGIPLSPVRFLFLSLQLPYDTERLLRRKKKFFLYITA